MPVDHLVKGAVEAVALITVPWKRPEPPVRPLPTFIYITARLCLHLQAW